MVTSQRVDGDKKNIPVGRRRPAIAPAGRCRGQKPASKDERDSSHPSSLPQREITGSARLFARVPSSPWYDYSYETSSEVTRVRR